MASRNPRRLVLTLALITAVSFQHCALARGDVNEASTNYVEVSEIMSSQDYKKAIQHITKLQKSGDNSFELNQLLVEAYGERIEQVGMLKKMSTAKKLRKAMAQSVKLRPNDLQAQENLIQFDINAPGIVGGDKDNAVAMTDAMMKTHPLRAHVFKAHIATVDKDYDSARSHFAQAFEIDPANEFALMQSGQFEANQENYSGALVTLEKCIYYNPENFDCHYQIGKSAQLGNTELERGIEALTVFITNGHVNKEYLGYAHYRLGELHLLTGAIEEAKKQFETAIETADVDEARKALKNVSK